MPSRAAWVGWGWALGGLVVTAAYWAGAAEVPERTLAAFARAQVLGYAFTTSLFDLWVRHSPSSYRAPHIFPY
jgi:hypothetical protein